jgi:hypothetical protein
VFCGGTTMAPQYVRFIVEEVLEGRIGFYPTYGNTLMGLAASVPLLPEDKFSITYYAPQPRAVLRVVNPKQTDETVGLRMGSRRTHDADEGILHARASSNATKPSAAPRVRPTPGTAWRSASVRRDGKEHRRRACIDRFSNAELAIALLNPALRYSPQTLRLGAAMLGATGNSPELLAQLAREERCESIVRYVADAGRRYEPDNEFWIALTKLLPDAAAPKSSVVPHPTRFISMTGFTRRGVETVVQWIRPGPVSLQNG